MKKFKFRLEPLLNYRKYLERIAQQRTAKAQLDVKDCEKQVSFRLDAQIRIQEISCLINQKMKMEVQNAVTLHVNKLLSHQLINPRLNLTPQYIEHY